MKKFEKILIIILLFGALYFIGNTTYKTIKIRKNNIESLKENLLLKQTEIEELIYENNLLINHYCASENLLDTLFYHLREYGLDIQYPPYLNSITLIFENESYYKELELLRVKIK